MGLRAELQHNSSVLSHFYRVSSPFQPTLIHLDPKDPYTITDKKRTLGLMIVKGSSVQTVCSLRGFEQIENPYL
jgi:hypothetical protein